MDPSNSNLLLLYPLRQVLKFQDYELVLPKISDKHVIASCRLDQLIDTLYFNSFPRTITILATDSDKLPEEEQRQIVAVASYFVELMRNPDNEFCPIDILSHYPFPANWVRENNLPNFRWATSEEIESEIYGFVKAVGEIGQTVSLAESRR